MKSDTVNSIALTFVTAETASYASNAVLGNPDVDDFLLLYVFMDNGNTNDAITTPTGWTKLDQWNVGGAATAIYYKVSDGTETSVTITGWSGNEDVSILVMRFKGVDTSTPFDVTWNQGSHTSYVLNTVNPTGPSLTTATAGACVVAGAGFVAGGTTGAPRRSDETNGWTSCFITADSGSFIAGWHVADSAGSVGSSWNVATPSTADWDCWILALKASGAS